MKLFILIVLFQTVALFSARGQTQAGSDSVGASARTPSEKRSQVVEKRKESGTEKATQKNVQQPEAPLKGFIDENGDGVDDRIQNMKRTNQTQMKHTMHDRFIDNDGDGINDDRCGSMGIAPKKDGCSDGRHR